jgi:hypothetical protein
MLSRAPPTLVGWREGGVNMRLLAPLRISRGYSRRGGRRVLVQLVNIRDRVLMLGSLGSKAILGPGRKWMIRWVQGQTRGVLHRFGFRYL